MKKSRNGFVKNLHYLCLTGVIALGLMTIVATGGGGGGGAPAPGGPDCAPPSFDATGTWSTVDTETYDSDGEPLEVEHGTCTITQTNTSFTVETDDGLTLDGTVCGAIYTFSGSWDMQEPGGQWGTATVEGTFTLTSETTFVGDYTFEWTDGSYIHYEEWDVTGTKQIGPACAGPVPCLTQDWGATYYEFREQDGNPIIVISDGNIFAEAGMTDDGHIIGLGGTVTDCYNGNITEGAIDWNDNGTIDDSEWFSSVSGNLNICDRTLRISNFVIEGVPEDDIVATYQGVVTSLVNNEIQIDRKIPPKLLLEIMDKLSSE